MSPKRESAARNSLGRGIYPVIAAMLVFLAGLAVSHRVAFLQYMNGINQMRDRIGSELDQVRGDLARELIASVNLTQGLVSLVSIQGGISQQEFEAMASELMRYARIIRNVALAPDNVIRFVYPLDGNEGALGLDYMKTPSQRETVQRAISENQMVIAGPVHLVQGGTGIIARAPIFVSDPRSPGKDRRYWGISATVLNFDALIRAARVDKTPARLRIALRGKDGLGSRGEGFWGDTTIFNSDPVLMDVALPSGSWQIAAMPIEGWPAFRMFASLSFFAGFAVSIFSALLIFVLIRANQARGLEVRERQKIEQTLRQANRALRLFSLCNSAVVHAAEEDALLAEICRIAVESAGYRMAWVGRAESDEAKTVRPVAYAGTGEGFLDRIRVSWANDKFGKGTAGTAIRTRKPSIARDLLHNPDFSEWRSALQTRDYASAIAVPLIIGDRVFGVLIVYASEPDAFDTTEVELLEELGSNISHGMSALRAQRERAAAMAALERARNELEDRVTERTRELTAKNNALSEEIERRRRAEKTLHDSREKYRELVENANSIILRIDMDAKVTFFNEFAQKFFGYTEPEILGRSVHGTILAEVEEGGRNLYQLMEDLRRNPQRYEKLENENMRKDGERVWIAWTNKPILDSAGRTAEILCIGNDISDLKRTERELLCAKEAAESADRIKSAFLATMSHELRTPLNSIIGFTGILLQGLAGDMNPEQRKQLGMVQNAARHLLALINDVLDISKIEAGQLEVRSDLFDLRKSIEKVVMTIGPLAEKKGLQLDWDVAPDVLQVKGDQRRVEQVLINLLSNAIKFTETGTVTVHCGLREGFAEVSIKDTGIGIGPEDREAIFRPFHQIDNGLTRRHEGTGLGLSICKRLLDLMSGAIRVESEPGLGSVFTFTIPRPRGA